VRLRKRNQNYTSQLDNILEANTFQKWESENLDSLITKVLRAEIVGISKRPFVHFLKGMELEDQARKVYSFAFQDEKTRDRVASLMAQSSDGCFLFIQYLWQSSIRTPPIAK
jgi:hypothetical protein